MHSKPARLSSLGAQEAPFSNSASLSINDHSEEACCGAGMWCLTGPRVRRYLTSMRTTVSSKGQIVLPAEFRRRDRVEPGQEFDVERLDRGDYRLVRRAPPRNEGVIDWLLACPQKDFFVPIQSETTDAL